MAQQSPALRAGRRTRTGPAIRPPSLAWVRIDVHPFAWLRAYPLVAPTLLIALCALMYMLQVNQGQMLDFQLSALEAQQTQLNGAYAQDAARMDSLVSCERVCAIAAQRLHMDHPNLTSALWITVELPPSIPLVPQRPVFHTGPLSWIENALDTIGKSL